jgi:hypothetical protein
LTADGLTHVLIEGQEIRIHQRKQSLNDQERRRANGLSLTGYARVRREIVERPLDRIAARKRRNLGNEQRALDQRRVIEVLQGSFRGRHVRQVAVIKVEGKMDAVERARQFRGERCFAGSGAAGDSEDDWRKRQPSELSCNRH